MATAAGIDMTECTILEEGGRAHFATRRFDRVGAERIHASTLCAMAELDFRAIGVHDYSQLFQTVDRLELGPSARHQVFRRMAFNVAAANCDDHTKNFAFLLPHEGRWTLAPAYDVTHAHLPGNRWIERHLMSVNGRFEQITSDDLLSVADRFAVPEATGALREVLAATRSWGDFAREAGVPSEQIDRVGADLVAARP
jgi:serine/threonine-protein kinase HipA